jgi:hypothetical protein
MGHKKVSLECKIAFNLAFDRGLELAYACTECGKPMTLLPHRFRPPKRTDDSKRELVRFLVENGFYYQHIPEAGSGDKPGYVKYPDNLREAADFVIKYKNMHGNEQMEICFLGMLYNFNSCNSFRTLFNHRPKYFTDIYERRLLRHRKRPCHPDRNN